MGIRGLQNWVRWIAPQTIHTPNWSEFSGKRVGIDILGFLYRAKSQGIFPVYYVAQLIAACKRLTIEPIVIFDGKPPSEKQQILTQRNNIRNLSIARKAAIMDNLSTIPIPTNWIPTLTSELQKLELNSTYFTSEERDQVKQFLYACGVLSLNASGEADNTLAYFSRKGWISAVISSDFDLLPRGVETLLVPEFNYKGVGTFPGAHTGWKQYTLSTILKHTDMSYDQFLEMCVFMGSDYTANMPSIPYKSAYWAIKYAGSLEYTLARYNIYDYKPYIRAKQILKGDTDTEESLMGTKQWEKWYGQHPDIEYETLIQFARLYFPSMETIQGCNPIVLGPGTSLLHDLTQHITTTKNTCSTACS
jgi:flap endonuclease-1